MASLIPKFSTLLLQTQISSGKLTAAFMDVCYFSTAVPRANKAGQMRRGASGIHELLEEAVDYR